MDLRRIIPGQKAAGSWGQYQEFGFDVQLQRASSKHKRCWPSTRVSLKAGIASQPCSP